MLSHEGCIIIAFMSRKGLEIYKMIKLLCLTTVLSFLILGCTPQTGENSFSSSESDKRSVAQEKNVEILSQLTGSPVIDFTHGEEVYSKHLKLGDFENGHCSIHKYDDGSILELFTSNLAYAGHYIPNKIPKECSCELFDIYFEKQIRRPFLIPVGQPGAQEKLKIYLERKSNLEDLTSCKFGKTSTVVTPQP